LNKLLGTHLTSKTRLMQQTSKRIMSTINQFAIDKERVRRQGDSESHDNDTLITTVTTAENKRLNFDPEPVTIPLLFYTSDRHPQIHVKTLYP
jgi:hypothetical protein